MGAPGRVCPLSYRHAPESIAAAPVLHADTLYVVGGLYGNGPALEAVLAMAAREPDAVVVFNGDFHWFDVAPARFADIDAAVLAHRATRGNVETELGAGGTEAGCGCAYPDWVDGAVVERSNAIMERLCATAAGFPELTARLAALPPYLRFRVGPVAVAVVHGDAESLAGWGFSREALANPGHGEWLRGCFRRAAVGLFACTHTCLPALHGLELGDGVRGVIANNGAAGMPNFRGHRYGLLTRIATRPPQPATALYGTVLDGVHVHALPVRYDHQRWRDEFLESWPPGSPAHASYFQRIQHGTDLEPENDLKTMT